MNKLSIAFLAAVSIASFGCKKKGGAGEAMAKMTEFKDKMCACKDKACADKVQDEMNKWTAENAKNAGDKADKSDDKTMKEMQDVGTKYGECMAKAMGGGDMAAPPAGGSADGSAAAGSAAPAAGSADGSAAPAAAAGDLPAECKDYQAAIEALAKCDKLPQATRDALKQSYEQTSAAWASVPAEGRAALGTACKSAADAVKQSAAACN